jgi:hypothetical protein
MIIFLTQQMTKAPIAPLCRDKEPIVPVEVPPVVDVVVADVPTTAADPVVLDDSVFTSRR